MTNFVGLIFIVASRHKATQHLFNDMDRFYLENNKYDNAYQVGKLKSYYKSPNINVYNK